MTSGDDITIIGFGSLLSEKDARRTCPSLKNFRYGRVPGYARVFGKVDSNESDLSRKEIASWAFFEAGDHETLVTLFEIPQDEYESFVEREVEYCLKSVKYIEQDTGKEGQGIACCAFQSNDEFVDYLNSQPLQRQIYDGREADKDRGEIWRDDILPRNKYLAFCLEAARNIHDKYVENILNQSYLGDRKTTIRSYLKEHHQTLPHIQSLEWVTKYL